MPGLVAHPGIAFAVVDTADHGPVVIGANGEHRVRDGVVVGDDPLAPFGPEAPEFVLRAAPMPEAPDIYVNSLLDELGEVAAFEGLVGCHGGLGGWQDRAMIVWPTELPGPAGWWSARTRCTGCWWPGWSTSATGGETGHRDPVTRRHGGAPA